MFSYATRSRSRMRQKSGPYKQVRRSGLVSAPPIVGAQPRYRRSTSVGGRTTSRVPAIVKQHYRLGTVHPVFVNRARSYAISAADGEQALVTFVPNKIRSAVNVARVNIGTGMTNEVELDTRPIGGGVTRSNFFIQDSLPIYNEGSTLIGSNYGCLPVTSWILGDNWAFRDMLLYLNRKYNINSIRHGYLPPSVTTLAANTTYGGFAVGPTAVTSPVMGLTAQGNIDNTATVTLMNAVDQDDLTLNDVGVGGDSTGYGESGVGPNAKHLFVHNMTIDFTVTNLEENPVDVVMYELILKRDMEFQYGGTPTGSYSTTTYAPCNAGLPDPVELWQTMANRKRGSTNPFPALGDNTVGGNSDDVDYNGMTKLNSVSVYEPNMDPMNHLDRWYHVKRRSARIEPSGKYRFNYVLKMNRTCPPWWLDKLYAYGGFTRQFMLRCKGTPGLARTSAILSQGVTMGTTTQDCNIRVDVNKSFRASLLPRKQRHNFIERINRILPSSIVATLGVNAEGEMELTDGVTGENTGTTQKVSFSENSGQLS